MCHLDRLLAQREMTLTELAQRVGVTVVNLSILKNDRAKAVRFSTLTRICDALGCQPGDLAGPVRGQAFGDASPPASARRRRAPAARRARFIQGGSGTVKTCPGKTRSALSRSASAARFVSTSERQ